ncbi:MAG TPA: nucleotidyltransferase family protein [Gammaproteobacteria bacterium]|nr:nucleotidyltransferase family protein [Gammaproteobacteria bacterium]
MHPQAKTLGTQAEAVCPRAKTEPARADAERPRAKTERAHAEALRPKAIQAALRTTTEALARELAAPTNTAPDWSEFEWRIACAAAAIHGVSPLLAGNLLWRGPGRWAEFLENQRTQTAARHSRIEELLRVIDHATRREGICAVALKGAELHARGLYSPGERPMADVDLLVPSADFERAARILKGLGFDESFSTWKHRVFVRDGDRIPAGLGEHADNYMKIELHERIGEGLPLNIEDVSDFVFPSRPRPGLNPYPSPASLMVHLLLHAAGAMMFRALRLLHLHDLALLSSHMTDEDWDEVLAYRESRGGLRWAFLPLNMTAHYYTSAVPAPVLAALREDCSRLPRLVGARRTLSDVSLSYLWIPAFPGIEWSQSPLEMGRYVMRRIRPNRELLEVRRQLARTQVAAWSSSWSGLSQGRRILRWATSRQARPDTMHSVHLMLTER